MLKIGLVDFYRPLFALLLLALKPFIEKRLERDVRVFERFAPIAPGQGAAQKLLGVLTGAVEGLGEIVIGPVRPVATEDFDLILLVRDEFDHLPRARAAPLFLFVG